jgi:hypothetical protein
LCGSLSRCGDSVGSILGHVLRVWCCASLWMFLRCTCCRNKCNRQCNLFPGCAVSSPYVRRGGKIGAKAGASLAPKGEAVMSGETLSLKQAAKMAGVSEVTMRSWVLEIPSVVRSKGGAYEIPADDLRGYLAGKDPHKTRSGGKAKSSSFSPNFSPNFSPPDEVLQLLREQNARLVIELSEAKQELKEMRMENRKLEAELRAHLSGGVTGALSRWIKGR